MKRAGLTPPLFRWCRSVPKTMRPLIALVWRVFQGLVIAFAALAVLGVMVWWNDPLWVMPGGISGRIVEDGAAFRLVVSGRKYRHCPGHWSVAIDRDGGGTVTARGDLSPLLVPVGRLSNHETPPLQLPQWAEPLDPNVSHSAVATVVYQCGLFYPRLQMPGVYPHEFTFTIQPSMPPSSEDEMSQQRSRRAKV